MRVLNGCLYIEDVQDESVVSYLLGYRRSRGSSLVRFEDNIVNRIVLGLQPVQVNSVPDCQWNGLEDYQNLDVVKMIQLGNVLNRNRMGLGKTVETITALRAQDIHDAVIVAPKPVCQQWATQYGVWWPEMSGYITVGAIGPETSIINYEKLLQPATMRKLRNHRHQAVVFDEVHKLKNRKSQRTAAAELIPAGVHIGLTGTPILRHPDDLWSELHVIDPMYSGSSYWAFTQYFCHTVLGEHGRSIEGLTQDSARLAILQKLLDAVSISNNVEVAKGKRRVEVVLEMSKAQKTLYDRVKGLVLKELPENCTIANGAVLLTRLMQVTSWPEQFGCNHAGAKFEWIKEFCSNTEEQILILTKFAETAKALYQYLRASGTSCAIYTGQQTGESHRENKSLFISQKAQVLIGTIGAVGTGMDGLQVARLGIMLERDWSPEINEQCEDRLHRKGQEQQVTWYYLSCKGTADAKVDRVNLKKADDIRACLEGER